MKIPLLIIGAGPGGYTAAFHAADLGLDVTLVDPMPNPGGVCLYKGCIPSKALLHAAKVMTEAEEADTFGIHFNKPQIDIEKLRNWKKNIVIRLTDGLDHLRKQRKIHYIQGKAKFLNTTTVEISKKDQSTETISFENVILATGSHPTSLPNTPDSPRIWNSTDALELNHIPDSLLIIGGGYIGLELGSVYASLGSNVSIVEMTKRLLPGADRDLVLPLERRLKQKCEAIMLSTKVLSMEETNTGIKVQFKDKQGKLSSNKYQNILIAIGRKPNLRNIGLETIGININEKGFISVDNQRKTNISNIYAIGDITGEPMLAHKASHEAIVAVKNILGEKTSFIPKAIPAVIFTDPEITWCGITAQEAKEKNIPIEITKFPWAASGRAITLNRPEGVTKLIIDKETRKILGVGITGPGAGELIAEGALAVEKELLVDDLKNMIHPHPTLSETIMESAQGFFGQSIHIYKPKR